MSAAPEPNLGAARSGGWLTGAMRRVPAESDFSRRLRAPVVAARIGLWLGIAFGVCFLTGLISHAAQEPAWPFPSRPVSAYRVTQGLHVIAGTAAVPLLLVKLWTVFPALFARPPRAGRELVLHGAERVSIAILVAASIFQLAAGLANSGQWYPWAFSFRATHFAMGWIAIGALLVHVAVKLPIIRAALVADVELGNGAAGDIEAGDIEVGAEVVKQVPVVGARQTDVAGRARQQTVLSRRGLLRVTWAAAGVAVLATAGSTVPALRRISLLGVRSGEGPGGVPINKTARSAGVTAAATSPAYRLTIVHGNRRVVLTHDELVAKSGHTETLPIACVEGWSASGEWTGVRIRDLLALVGTPRGSAVRVTSLQQRGPFRVIDLPGNFADDPLTLLATGLAGRPLTLDHGAPCRLIAPNRPGVLQTKWVTRLEVLT
ncbi:MAG: molybdopterin-dependent oxidoreductase [Nocardioides sp.]